jgi:hypothetical protein
MRFATRFFVVLASLGMPVPAPHSPAWKSSMRTIGLLSLLTAVALGQATFDLQGPMCGPAFPVGCGAFGDPEGCAWNGVVAAPAVFGATCDGFFNTLGLPCGGPQYARIPAANVGGVISLGLPGGPAPETGVVVSDQLYIPIPPGATTVSFCWDFYNEEVFAPLPTYNDGMSVDVVGPLCGPALANIVYADCATPVLAGFDAGACGVGATLQVAPAGPQMVIGAALPAGGVYLRVTVWNDEDDLFDSHGVIDEVTFGFGVPACVLLFTSPGGPGTLAVANTPCPAVPGASYITAVTLAAGAYPAGWFFGVDIAWVDLAGQVTAGPPFSGALDAAGSSFFGPIPGVPGALTLYAVTAHLTPGFGLIIGSRPPVTYTTP